jgi:hypothetical protein
VTPDDTDTPTVPPPSGAGLGQALMVLDAVSQIDNFGINAVGKNVAEVANNLAQSSKTAAAQFVMAAKAQGLSPKSKITAQILTNPATAMPLAKALGVGANLPRGGRHCAAIVHQRTCVARLCRCMWAA